MILKAYSQGKDISGQKFYNYTIIDINPDNNEHLYSATVRKNNPNIIDFYIDNILKGTIVNDLYSNYYNVCYHLVGTTHRNYPFWNSDQYKIKFRDITTITI